jgi:hypothetical protein
MVAVIEERYLKDKDSLLSALAGANCADSGSQMAKIAPQRKDAGRPQVRSELAARG